MSEHLRAFVVITGLMALAFLISKRLFSHALEPRFVERLYGTGYAATALMFLAHNMWAFLAGLAGLSFLVARRFSHPLALFIFLLLLMPGFTAQVPGFGLINYLIDLSPARILAMTLLLPATLVLMGNKSLPRPGQLLADKVVIAYALYTSALTYLHYETFTGGMRHLTTTALDFVLLYFVASRGLLLKAAVRHVMVALIMAAIYLALVGAFEFGKHWLLYSSAAGALGASTAMFGYLGRGDTLRALASTGQPIALGFVMMVALLMSSYVQRLVSPGSARIVLWMTMAMGLVAAMSRGPWVGAAIGLFVVALASTNPLSNGLKLLAASLGATVVLVMLPGGEKILNYLPWVGEIDSSNITFRETLWQQTLLVVEKNLWVGSIDFPSAPEFDVIRLGSGFVDFVNSYLVVVLSYGLIGLGLYILLILVSLLPNIVNAIIGSANNNELALYSMAMLATLVASIITIWTVSSVGQIAPLLTFVLGAGVSNAWLCKQSLSRQVQLEHQKCSFKSPYAIREMIKN